MKRSTLVVDILVVLVIGIFVLVGIMASRENGQRPAGWRQAEAKVIGFNEKRTSSRQTSYAPIVEFLDSDNRYVRYESTIFDSLGLSINDTISVYYNPDTNDVRIPKTPTQKFVFGGLTAFGLGLGLLYFGFARRKLKQQRY